MASFVEEEGGGGSDVEDLGGGEVLLDLSLLSGDTDVEVGIDTEVEMLSIGSGGSDFGVEGTVIEGVTVVEVSITPGRGGNIGPSQPNSSASQCKNN